MNFMDDSFILFFIFSNFVYKANEPNFIAFLEDILRTIVYLYMHQDRDERHIEVVKNNFILGKIEMLVVLGKQFVAMLRVLSKWYLFLMT